MTGGDFHKEYRGENANLGNILFFFVYLFVTRFVLLNIALASVISNYRVVNDESEHPLPLLPWEVAAYRRVWGQFDPDGVGYIESAKLKNFLETFASRIKEEEAGKNRSERQRLVDELGMDAQYSNFSDFKNSPLASADEMW